VLNPNNDVLTMKDYSIVTMTEKASVISPEWLLYGATPCEPSHTIPNAVTSEEIVSNTISDAIKAYIKDHKWSPVTTPEMLQTIQLRLVVPHLSLDKLGSLKTEQIAEVFRHLGYNVTRPGNRLTIAYSVSPPTLTI
jgi:hypothetical protein